MNRKNKNKNNYINNQKKKNKKQENDNHDTTVTTTTVTTTKTKTTINGILQISTNNMNTKNQIINENYDHDHNDDDDENDNCTTRTNVITLNGSSNHHPLNTNNNKNNNNKKNHGIVLNTKQQQIQNNNNKNHWILIFYFFIIMTCCKILVMFSYRSTDYHVHKHWKAVTLSSSSSFSSIIMNPHTNNNNNNTDLFITNTTTTTTMTKIRIPSIAHWYYDDHYVDTIHTLDYPPGFMLFIEYPFATLYYPLYRYVYHRIMMINNNQNNNKYKNNHHNNNDLLDSTRSSSDNTTTVVDFDIHSIDECLHLVSDDHTTTTTTTTTTLGRNGGDRGCVTFMRSTVMIADLWLWFGAYIIAINMSSTRTRSIINNNKINIKIKNNHFSWTLFLYLICHPGFFWLDHIHFQYNGMLLGILLVSIGCFLRINHHHDYNHYYYHDNYDKMNHHQKKNNNNNNNSTYYSFHILHYIAAFMYAILVTMKHLYITLSLWYVAYMFRSYCCSSTTIATSTTTPTSTITTTITTTDDHHPFQTKEETRTSSTRTTTATTNKKSNKKSTTKRMIVEEDLMTDKQEQQQHKLQIHWYRFFCLACFSIFTFLVPFIPFFISIMMQQQHEQQNQQESSSDINTQPVSRNPGVPPDSIITIQGWLKQLQSRLFPFQRGLVHDYWAGNIWAIYVTIQKIIRYLGTKSSLLVTTSNNNHPTNTGLIQSLLLRLLSWFLNHDTTTMTTIQPIHCAILLFIGLLPGAYYGWIAAATKDNILMILSLAYTSFVSFLVSYHVHEKAIMTTVVLISIYTVLCMNEYEQHKQQEQMYCDATNIPSSKTVTTGSKDNGSNFNIHLPLQNQQEQPNGHTNQVTNQVNGGYGDDTLMNSHCGHDHPNLVNTTTDTDDDDDNNNSAALLLLASKRILIELTSTSLLSLLPLLHQPTELPIKLLSYVAYVAIVHCRTFYWEQQQPTNDTNKNNNNNKNDVYDQTIIPGKKIGNSRSTLFFLFGTYIVHGIVVLFVEIIPIERTFGRYEFVPLALISLTCAVCYIKTFTSITYEMIVRANKTNQQKQYDERQCKNIIK